MPTLFNGSYPQLMPTLFNGCGFGPPSPFTVTSSWSWVDHPVSGLRDLTFGLFALAFTSAPYLRYLTSPDPATRRTVLQKVRRCTVLIVLRQFVNTGFQVLFHSPPGVLFTFPSQYYALSVTQGFRFSFTPLPGSFSPFLHSTMRYRSLRSI